eukprot:108649_1
MKCVFFFFFFFYGLLFIFNAIFEIFYVIFPLLLLGDNLSFTTAAAKLHCESTFIFFAVVIPFIFLCYKIFNVLRHLTKLGRDQMYVPISSKRSNSLSELEQSLILHDRNGLNITNDESKMELISNVTRNLRIYMISCNFIWIICGVLIMILTLTHFNKYQKVCNDYNQYKEDYPELYLWKYCNFQVYPFFPGDDIACNCRGFSIPDYTLNSDEGSVVNGNMLTSLLRHWYMLETLQFHADNNIISFNLTCNELQSKNMRALEFSFMNLNHIDANCWINWRNLQYLVLNGVFPKSSHGTNPIPSSTSSFTKLKHFELNYNTFPPTSEALNIFCSFANVGYIAISMTGQPPNCVSNLKNIQYLDMSGSTIVHDIDINILSIKSLTKLVAVNSAYLNVTSFNIQSDEHVKYNTNAKYFFQGTDLCAQFMNFKTIKFNDSIEYYWSDIYNTYYPHLYQFLNDTNACEQYCNYTNSNWGSLASWWCLEKDYSNGICDPACNYIECGFDGKDCNQLCECDISLLTNRKCDIECNTTNCNYDAYECVVDKNVDFNKCFRDTKCEKTFIDDGLCDDYCQSAWCNYDGQDCGTKEDHNTEQ